MNAPKLSARLGAEFLGTFWLAGATYAIITGVHREDRDVSGDVAAPDRQLSV